MIEFGLLALLGIALGAFGTLVGAGGGFLLVPILLFAYPEMSPSTVTAMSLFVVLANATSGTLAYWRQGRIDLFTGGIFAAATIPSAIAGAIIVAYIPRQQFNVMFAVALAAIGLWLLAPRPATTEIRAPLAGRGVIRRRITDRNGLSFVYGYRLWQGLSISAGVGFISSLLGIGGGIVHVPAMVMVLRFPVYVATATSQFVLAIMASQAVAVHVARGTLAWDITLGRASAIAVGAILGAQVGAYFSHRVQGDTILRALGAALLLVAARLIWAAR
ncbi:MAG: sulfite exporter TauE/SafE family protein [Chloroflexi bacterium]|nr:sulfite exporter TauE/SafE family protein [Chloroflexota bacterium]